MYSWYDEAASFLTPERRPTDAWGTPVWTSVVFVETVSSELLHADLVEDVGHKLAYRANRWAELNGYTVNRTDVEVGEMDISFRTHRIRITAQVTARTDGEWPSIRRAVHEDQKSLTDPREREPDLDLARLARATVKATAAFEDFSHGVSEALKRFDGLPTPPAPF